MWLTYVGMGAWATWHRASKNGCMFLPPTSCITLAWGTWFSSYTLHCFYISHFWHVSVLSNPHFCHPQFIFLLCPGPSMLQYFILPQTFGCGANSIWGASLATHLPSGPVVSFTPSGTATQHPVWSDHRPLAFQTLRLWQRDFRLPAHLWSAFALLLVTKFRSHVIPCFASKKHRTARTSAPPHNWKAWLVQNSDYLVHSEHSLYLLSTTFL